MNRLKVLISPLSWGFGHAGRMIPLALALQRRGCEVIFAADAHLIRMAGKDLPGIRMIEIPGLRIRYSRFLPQYICIAVQLPCIVASAVGDHMILRRLAADIQPEVIISDNRFGFYSKDIFSAYVTHQVRFVFPWLLRWLEPFAAWTHRMIIKRYDLCLVPDYQGEVNLSGRLSHGGKMPERIIYMGPLSRFAEPPNDEAGAYRDEPAGTGRDPAGAICDEPGGAERGPAGADFDEPGGSGCDSPEDFPPLPEKYACLILSGPEPQRSLLLEKVTGAIGTIPLAVLTATPVNVHCGPGVQLITAPGTETMRRIISGAAMVVARAGYTSVMELVSLNRGAVIIPTPGQTEQEYLGRHLDGRYGFITMKQNRPENLASISFANHNADNQALPVPAPLLEKAVNLLLEYKKK